MEVDPETGVNQSQYQGLIYYFCSPDCHSKFNAHPEKFAGEFGVDLREAARLSPSYPPSQGYGAAGPPSVAAATYSESVRERAGVAGDAADGVAGDTASTQASTSLRDA